MKEEFKLPADWTDKEVQYLKENYAITSFVEFAKVLGKTLDEIKAAVKSLNIRASYIENTLPELRLRLSIMRLMDDFKQYLPNGWLVGLAMSSSMLRSLTEQIEEGSTDLLEIEEEINSVLDAIVEGFEFIPLFSVGDMLMGADRGQAYRITGREFIPNSKMLTYYFTYLYGGDDTPEDYDDDFDDEEPNFTIHNN